MDPFKRPILHDLLQQDQEPFHLQTHISNNRRPRSHLNVNPSPPPQPLHVPPGLLEAAARIHNHRRSSKPKTLAFFGSFLKLLKHRSGRNELILENSKPIERRQNSEEIRISCSCDYTADFEARFHSSPISPFVFSPRKSPTFSGRLPTPELRSPATSPIRRVNQEENSADYSENGGEEEKEQCSPVSVLDTFFEDDDEHETIVGDDEEEDDNDCDLERYANIERARQQLLERLERFEKLAALDKVDLEEKLVEACDEIGGVEFTQALETSSLKHSPMKMCADIKRLIGEDGCKVVLVRNRSVWHSLQRARLGAIDMAVEYEEWERLSEVMAAEMAAEMEVAIFEGLMEELVCFTIKELVSNI